MANETISAAVQEANVAAASELDAFLSYSREDRALATRLQRRLQSFAKPVFRLRRMNVFRDESHLVGTELRPAIEAALLRARYLLLLASPHAAQSKWVERELQRWLAREPTLPILLVIAEGEVVWDDETNDFDWARTTALPRVLSKRFASEPRWFDLRGASLDSPERRARLESVVADVGCRVLDLPKDQLVGEDARQYRRLNLLRRLAIVSLTVLATAATTAAIIAYQKYQESERRLDSAFTMALDSLDTIEQLQTVPGAAKVRQSLVDRTETLLGQLAPDLVKTDRRLLSRQARSRVFAAEYALGTGDLDLASQKLNQAARLYERPEHRNDAWALAGLGDVYDRKARLAWQRGDQTAALAAGKEAVRCAEEVYRRDANDVNWGQLEVSYDNLGMFYQQLGQFDDARRFHAKGLEIAEALFAKDPSFERRSDVVASYVMLSELAQAQQQPARALEWLEKAHATLLAPTDPDASRMDDMRAEVALQLASHADYASAKRSAACSEGADAARRLRQADPDGFPGRLLLARALVACAGIPGAPDSVPLLQEARTLLEGMLQQQPDLVEVSRLLALVRAAQAGAAQAP